MSGSNFNSVSVPFSKNLIVCTTLAIILILAQPEVAFCYKIRSSSDALEYLSRFGYLPPDPQLQLPMDVSGALKDFQSAANLIPNGRLNRRTLLAMNRPRCGNRDLRIAQSDELLLPPTSGSRSKRSDDPFEVPKWRKRVLTYKVSKFASASLKPKQLQQEIDLGFKYWEREANLSFRRVWGEATKADIEIGFFSGEHGDEESFDGPSKTLAHAFYPTKGRIHFDDEERWTANTRHGHNLRTVAVHEIGHALGLAHSNERKAVMYSMYQGFKQKLQLHPDDIQAIRKLYGAKFVVGTGSQTGSGGEAKSGTPVEAGGMEEMISSSISGSTSGSTFGLENPPDLCSDPKFDAISTLADGHVYVFKGDFYFRLGKKEKSHFRQRINETFAGLPGNLDAVLTLKSGRTYFFKGRLYWRSRGTRVEPGYPRRISRSFPGIPSHLDGATLWSWNGMVYFFKKGKYWRYSFDKKRKFSVNATSGSGSSSKYPRKIGPNWPGIPDGIEDAFVAPNGKTYFFKNGEYWQFHDPDSDQEAASYPRPVASNWFGCGNKSGSNTGNANSQPEARTGNTNHERKRRRHHNNKNKLRNKT